MDAPTIQSQSAKSVNRLPSGRKISIPVGNWKNFEPLKWFLYEYYPFASYQRAIGLGDIQSRLAKKEIILFTPWGPRYDSALRGDTIQKSHAEFKLLTYLEHEISVWPDALRKKMRWIFVGADRYATINNLPSQAGYFESLRSILRDLIPFSEFHLWSKWNDEVLPLREEARKMYLPKLHPAILHRAKRIAEQKGGSWEEYLVERVAEAKFIEKRFAPIKISAASRINDSEIDVCLPRLYIVPEELRAPWCPRNVRS